MIKNEEILQKRAYLAPYLSPADVPDDFMQDDGMIANALFSCPTDLFLVVLQLLAQYQQLQEDFKVVHRQYDQTLEKNAAIADIKKDIKSLEEEKIQIAAKIHRHQSKMENMVRLSTPEYLWNDQTSLRCAKTDFDNWIEIARKLRIEQTNEMDLRAKYACRPFAYLN